MAMHESPVPKLLEQPDVDGWRSRLSTLLPEAIEKEHAFLRTVDELGDVLYDEDVIRVSALRYERLWIPAVAASVKQGAALPVPPLDIAFMWHCHVLCPTRYFSDYLRLAGKVPDFVFPGPPTVLPHGSPLGHGVAIDLSTKAAALDTMYRSLADAPSSNPPRRRLPGEGPAAAAADDMLYDVAASAMRQRVFFYQVSLPHYRNDAFLKKSVERYITFLSIFEANPGVKLCPTYDIDLVWHAHMSMPLLYKADTEALLGRHLPHDDSINDRSDGGELQGLQRTTERLFEEAGDQFFRAGGMFRGIPTRLTPQQRVASFPEAPPSKVLFTLKGSSWKCKEDDVGAPLPDVSVTAWSLTEAGNPLRYLVACCTAGSMQPAAEAVEAASDKPHKLRIRLEEAASGGCSRTFTASGTVTLHAATFLQRPGPESQEVPDTVEMLLDVPVILKAHGRARRNPAVLTLTVTKHFRYESVYCPLRDVTPHVGMEHAAAAAYVSQPELLLPPAAVNDVGNDIAETRCFNIDLRGGSRTSGFPGRPVLVRVTNTSKHLATAVEVFAAGADPSSDPPAATAHSVNLATLPPCLPPPTPETRFDAMRRWAMSRAVGKLRDPMGTSLEVGVGMRAFLIRAGDKDWGVLYGWWSKEREDRDHHYPGWNYFVKLHILIPGEATPRQGKPQHVECGGRDGTAHPHAAVQHDFGTGQGRPAVRDPGRLAAAVAAISVSCSLLAMMTMPCSVSVRQPQHAQATYERAKQDYPALRRQKPLLYAALPCRHLPSNGYIAKRLYALRERAPLKGQSALLQWYGSKDLAPVDAAEAVVWGGPDFDRTKMVTRRRRWAKANATRWGRPGAGENLHCGGCAGACGAGAGCGAGGSNCGGGCGG